MSVRRRSATNHPITGPAEENLVTAGHVVCCGPRRSGSSLVHNLVSDILDEAGLSESWQPVKAHLPAAESYRRTEGAPRRFVYVARDLRDVVVSDVTLHDLPNTFPRVAAMAVVPESVRAWEHWRVQQPLHQLAYDDLQTDLPGQIAALAKFLGAELSPEAVADIAARHGRDRVEARVAAHYQDRPTAAPTDIESAIGFRKGHFQGGATGKWRDQLSSWQVAFIEFHGGAWLEANGFSLFQPRWRRLAAAVAGAPFWAAGRVVTKAKLALGRSRAW